LKVHISRFSAGEEKPESATMAEKLMHRFTAEEVIKKMMALEKTWTRDSD